MELSENKHFVLRVYALIINDREQILLSDEFLFDRKMTKFPGGGMQYGEGTIDCLLREAVEEFGQEIEVTDHFYTTHFFQQALFYPDSQLVSIYYRARFREAPRFRISKKPFDFPIINGSQSFRWAGIKALSEDELSFPVDRYVLKLLKETSS